VFSLGTVRQIEGNGSTPVTVPVPWTLSAPLDHDATVNIVRGSKVQPLVIPAHTTSGTLPVRYLPNKLDDEGVRFIGLTAYAVSGVETDAYLGGAKIIDDDPTPALHIRARSSRITAGQSAVWIASLGKPVDYYAYAEAKVVKAGHGPQLRVGDLTPSFRKRYGMRNHLSMPLYKLGFPLYVGIRPHQTSGTLVLPTRAEHGVTRKVALRFRAPQFDVSGVVRTVTVAPRH
jgi:hypothetical protein